MIYTIQGPPRVSYQFGCHSYKQNMFKKYSANWELFYAWNFQCVPTFHSWFLLNTNVFFEHSIMFHALHYHFEHSTMSLQLLGTAAAAITNNCSDTSWWNSVLFLIISTCTQSISSCGDCHDIYTKCQIQMATIN